MTLRPEDLLNNRYRILEVLAQGGMGSVYRAEDETLGIEVAVKENLFASDGYARQFRREAMILATLRHPNLPRVTDQFIIEGQGQYLVMDYVHGEDMRQRIERLKALPSPEVISIGAAICDALSHLNSREPPIVHRDIKPGNVKITPQGHIYLVDFGLAKTLQGSQATTTGARAMTPGYSPPEQYSSTGTDHRSDIFSLGATLYAGITGVIPEDALSRAIEQVELTPIRWLKPDVSNDLADVIEKAMEIDPNDRYQTSQEFKQALLETYPEQQITQNVYMLPPMEVTTYKRIQTVEDDRGWFYTKTSKKDKPQAGLKAVLGRKSGRKSKRYPSNMTILTNRIGCGALTALIIFLALIGTYYVFVAPSGIAPLLIFPIATILENTQETGKSDIAGITTLGSESIVPNSLQDDSSGEMKSTPQRTSEINLTGSIVSTDDVSSLPVIKETRTPIRTTTARFTPAINPTPLGGGGQIAYASNRNGSVQIYISRPDGTNSTQVTEIPGGACQPVWSPDGSQLVFISPCEANQDQYPGSAMFIINTDGTGLIPLPTVPGGDFDPSWSPDGSRIAFTSLRDKGRAKIYVYDFTTQIVMTLSEIFSKDIQPSWSPDGDKIMFVSERSGSAQLWQMDGDGRNQQLFSKNTDYLRYYPDWSPDGKSILFTQLITMAGIPRLAVADYGSGEYVEYRLTQDQIPMREARYSPDGFWIVFEGWVADGNQNIFIIASNGASRQQVTDQSGANFDPSWNPANYFK